MRKPLLSAIGSAPLAAVLAIVSAGVTLTVAITTLSAGQVSGDAPLELIAALLLAAVATSEASRPRRRDRDRRRVVKAAGPDNVMGDPDELRPNEWLGIDREVR
jgi:hypothetical protein